MSLPDLVKAVRETPYYVMRTLPEIGQENPANPCFMAQYRGKHSLAFVEASSGAAAWKVRALSITEVLRSAGGVWRVNLDQTFPVVVLVFRPAKDESESQLWLDAMGDADNEDEMMVTGLDEALGNLSHPPEVALKRFEFVRWSVFDSEIGRLAPAGVALVSPDAGLVVRSFVGHEDHAESWNARFTSVPPDALMTINSVSERTEHFSAPEYIKAGGFDDAVERSIYRVAKDHYAKTGEVLLK